MGLIEKVISDSKVSSISTIILTIRGIVVIPIITNLLGASDYGIWTTATSFAMLLSTIGGFHLHGSLLQYSDIDQDKEQVYSDLLFLSVSIGTIVSTSVLLFGSIAPITKYLGIQDSFNILFSCCSLILVQIIFQINLNFPRAKGRVKMYDAIRVIKTAAETGILALVFFAGGSVVDGIWSLVINLLLFNIALFYMISSNNNLAIPEPENFDRYINFSGPMLPRELSSSVLSNADKYLILYFISPRAVGIYSVARGVSTFLTNFSDILNSTLYPSISSAWKDGKKNEIEELYAKIFRFYSILSIPALFGLSYLAEPVLSLISNRTIASEAALLVPIISFGFVMRGYDNPLSYILTATENTNKLALSTIIPSVLNIILNIALITQFGIIGAGVATMISQAFVTGLVYQFSETYIDIKIPYLTLLRCIISSGIMISILYIFISYPEGLVMTFLQVAFGVALYFTSLILLGEINQDEIEVVSSSLFE